MNGTLRDPAWWSWQPSGGGCRTMHRLRAPGAESYLSGRGWPESWWETPWTVGPRPLELQAGRTYDLFVSTLQCDRCSHLCTDPLTDQTLRQELLGLDWEQQPSTWWAHKAYEAKTASRSQSLPALLCICPETRAFGKRVSGLLIWREGVPKKAEPDSQPLLPMREKVSPGLQPYPNGPHADSHCETAIDLIFGLLPNSKCSTC